MAGNIWTASPWQAMADDIRKRKSAGKLLPTIPFEKELVRVGKSLERMTQQSAGGQRPDGLVDAVSPAPYVFVAPDRPSDPGLVDPFASSGVVTDLRQPVQLPPVAVEGRPPVVSGTVYQRVAPGKGTPGVGWDLTQKDYVRDNPMGLVDAANAGLFSSRVPKGVEMSPSAAYRAGLIDVYSAPAETGRLTVETPEQVEAVRAWRRGRDQSQEMVSDDARAMRQGFRDESAARRLSGTVRAAGRAGGAKEVVASILDESAADAASVRRMREARVTPVASAGVGVYDPVTGGGMSAPDRGERRPQTWSEYTPKELGDMVNDAVKSMMPEGDSKAFQSALMMAKTDQEKQAVYQQFSARPTPAQQLILDTALSELKKRQGTVSNGSGTVAERSPAKKASYKEGQSGVFNGKNYVFKNGKWTPA